jgi:hypothetical protein
LECIFAELMVEGVKDTRQFLGAFFMGKNVSYEVGSMACMVCILGQWTNERKHLYNRN